MCGAKESNDPSKIHAKILYVYSINPSRSLCQQALSHPSLQYSSGGIGEGGIEGGVR